MPKKKLKRGPRKPAPPASADRHVALALGYIDDVLTGKIPACKYVRQACRRQRDDLKRFKNHPVYEWSEHLAGRVCRFIECLPHIKGPKAAAGEKIVLEPWQCFILTTVFGWRRKDTGGRRFRRAYIEVPRGNGKSALSSAVALYALTSDGEAGPEVYSAATTKEQAKIVFNVAHAMLQKVPAFAAKLGVILNKGDIQHPKSNGVFLPLSREAKNQDGANVHVAIVDELHAHKTREIYDVLVTALAKRLASLLFVITTAGSNTSGICYEERTYATKVLEGVAKDESVFAVIYTIDEDDKWDAPESWIKANPNWGVSVQPDEIASLANKAMQLPSAQANFKTKHLDCWVNADEAAFDMRAWDRCGDAELTEEQFEEKDCALALDLASTTDIAAKAKVFWEDREVPGTCGGCGKPEEGHPTADDTQEPEPEPTAGEQAEEPASDVEDGEKKERLPRCVEFVTKAERHYFAFVRSYLSEAAVESARNSQYAGWAQEGWLKTTAGDVLDFEVVKSDVLDDRDRHRIVEAAYDPWQAQKLANELGDEGVTMVEVRPTVQNFSAPMKELDAVMRTGRLHHDANPAMRWMVSNVVAHTDAKDNVYPRKQRPENKIDGVVALIMALSRAMVQESDSGPAIVRL